MSRAFAAIIKFHSALEEGGLPLYEYQCLKCGALIEKIQKFSDPPLTKCEKCGGKLEKLLSAPAIQFKGSGWYITDYAKKSSAAPSESSEKPGKSADSDTKSKTSETPKTEPTKTK
jgi:putative FmdB family regulatory protein